MGKKKKQQKKTESPIYITIYTTLHYILGMQPLQKTKNQQKGEKSAVKHSIQLKP